MESYITLNGLRFYAYHGVLPQERRVGGYFVVSLRLGCDIIRAMQSDDVSDTLNYAEVYRVVKREMEIPSNLLEHAAGRIVRAISKSFPAVTSIDLTLNKVNPPMGADCQGAGVEVKIKK